MSDMKVRWRLHGDNENEPTSRHRGINVYNYLRSIGIDAGPWDGNEAADIIVLQYNLDKLPDAKTTGATVIYDCNDMVFSKHHENSEYLNAHIGDVDAVIAGSSRIMEHLQRKHSFVRCIPDAVDSEYFKVKPQAHDGINIVWMGRHDNITYFEDIDDAIERLSDEYDFTVVFMCPEKDGFGKSNIDKVRAKPYKGKHVEWSLQTAYEQCAIGDIAVTPLFNNEWCWCKCANKAGLFMASGIPTVSPKNQVYSELIEHGKSGMLAYGDDEWYNCIKSLIDNEKLRKKMSITGKRRAKAMLSIDSIGKQWVDIIERVRHA